MAKILIIDDSPILRETIKAVIEKAGHTVTGQAENSKDALNIYQKIKPELILLDILLPGESGLEILKKLKSIDNEIKVLVITAVNQDAVKDEVEKLGAKGILFKPFDPRELLTAIDKIVK
jgi:two-component system chemotaxis response regulator CheY